MSSIPVRSVWPIQTCPPLPISAKICPHPPKSTPRPARIPTPTHYPCHPSLPDQFDPPLDLQTHIQPPDRYIIQPSPISLTHPDLPTLALICLNLPRTTYTNPYTCRVMLMHFLHLSSIPAWSIWPIQAYLPLSPLLIYAHTLFC